MEPLPPHSPRLSACHRLRWSGRTDRGKVRRNNEDSFLCLRFGAQEVEYLGRFGEADTADTDFVFAVSDGMGGANAGELASRITVEKITRLLPGAFRQSAVGLETGHAEVLAELFDQIHRALMFVGYSYEETAGMGATLTLGWFTQGWLHFAHIGDSRLYYLPAGGGLRQVSQDDTYVGWLHRQGKINEREARTHPRRNLLQKALGAGHQFVDPQMGSVAYEPGDRFLLCTDGLTDGLFDAQLVEFMDPGDPSGRLVNESLDRSGRDNTTALVVEVAAQEPADAPA